MPARSGASISRILGTACALDQLAHRVNIDPEVSERAGRFFIVSDRREEIADTKLGSTVVQRVAGGSP